MSFTRGDDVCTRERGGWIAAPQAGGRGGWSAAPQDARRLRLRELARVEPVAREDLVQAHAIDARDARGGAHVARVLLHQQARVALLEVGHDARLLILVRLGC